MRNPIIRYLHCFDLQPYFLLHDYADCCRISSGNPIKEISSPWNPEIQSKERFLHRITVKNIYLVLCFAPLWIFSGLLLLYDLYIAIQNIPSVFCLQRLFLFLVSLSPSYFGGSSAFLSPISICCGFTPLLLLPCFVSAFLYMAALSPLFFRSFDVETSL